MNEGSFKVDDFVIIADELEDEIRRCPVWISRGLLRDVSEKAILSLIISLQAGCYSPDIKRLFPRGTHCGLDPMGNVLINVISGDQEFWFRVHESGKLCLFDIRILWRFPSRPGLTHLNPVRRHPPLVSSISLKELQIH